ncbi:phage head-tail connector protein [Brevibacillus laterosporus]|uniref:Phage head-tail connector protein n=1 Tax=Brevibacillus halotolerans TaxID=1507437 RepID=A0ABT4HYC7_9BACL|nr:MULTISPECIES: phage head-tail connector protein [Brevibacillus]MCR8985994.1 phage head-tail connector protein [Brevibacillus laterosporus]MCZ0831727.1 phage head-tail connector protein [Brevibacillus halotolerans]
MLTTLEKAKQMLGMRGSVVNDTLLLPYITVASQQIEAYCKRKFRKQDYTEYHDGGRHTINLLHLPIHDIHHVKGPSGSLSYKLLKSQGSIYCPYGFPAGKHGIEITYNGGYVLPGEATEDKPQTLPEAIEMACILLVKDLLHESTRVQGIESERLDVMHVKYRQEKKASASHLPLHVVALLSPYVSRWV